MAWLRIDDGFAAHPKVTALNHRDRWTWVAILCYCARYGTDGWLPENISEHVSGAKNGFISRCVQLGLIDENDGEYRVHDWQHYGPKDPTKADRQAKWRRQKQQPQPRDVDAHVDALVDAWK